MSSPVRGSPSQSNPSNAPGQQPDSGGDAASRIAEGVLRSRDSSPPPSLSSHEVQPGGTEPSGVGGERSINSRKGEILQAWKRSLPFWGIFSEADYLIRTLSGINLDQPFTVDLKEPYFFGSISSLPDVFQNCTKFSCTDYSNLKTLPPLPNCQYLLCFMCSSLETLPDLPNCTRLDIYYCHGFQELTPGLPKCTELKLYSCQILRSIPALPVCIKLTCHECPNLRSIPALPSCTELELYLSRQLRSIPALPVCIKLTCHECPDLQSIPVLPSCTELNLYSCGHLRHIPIVPEYCIINIGNCPLLFPPQPTNPYQDRIDLAAQGTLQGALSFWSRLLPQGQAPLHRAEDLKFNDNTRANDQRLFQIFLNRLQETADFRQASPRNKQNFAIRVATIVRDMATSEEFCEKAIWALDSANTACGDRVTTGIESLETLSLIYGQKKPQTDVDTACLAIRLDRLDQVRKKALALDPGPEGLETVLFLQLKLKDRLQLPLQTGGMLYERIGGVSKSDVNNTAQEILAATSTDAQVIEILVNSEVWTDFLHREPNAVYYDDVQEGLRIIADSGEGLDYSAKLRALKKKPTYEWKEFLDNVGPLNTPHETRGAFQREVLQTLEEACPSLTGTEYSVALTTLTQQIDRKKTTDWLKANGNALRFKLN